MKKILFGLIGKKLSHSFSKTFFTQIFQKYNLPKYQYKNFELSDIAEFPKLMQQAPNLIGLNVTTPYKESIIKYLNKLSEEAQEIKAVNTIKIINRQLIGYNTDIFGFEQSIKHWLKEKKLQALILGSGGASKAVSYVLKKYNIKHLFLSRQKSDTKTITYKDLTPEILTTYRLIVNTTPVGMYPNTYQAPPLPYRFITSKHYCYDLIYNPEETLFLKKCKHQKAKTKNGFDMLIFQAIKSLYIWIKD